MEKKVRIYFDTKVIFGLCIIAAGILFLLENLDLSIGIDIWQFWPVILILIGLNQIARPIGTRQTVSGLVLIIAGLLFLFDNLDIIPYEFEDFWPIILILIGILIVKNAVWGLSKASSTNDYINLSFIMGGGDFKFTTDRLKGGKVVAVMGGGTIDLREADMKEDNVVIDTFAFCGGIEIKVPLNWQVNMSGTPILGGMDNKTNFSLPDANASVIEKDQKKLTIKGAAIMGGVEVKN